MKKQEPTRMMKQYLKIKEEYKDCILFFRLGDFYEMFYEDAVTASEVLEITLTGKDCGLKERAPMCGVPFHSAQNYIAKLIKNGYKVAICEQVEDPKHAKDIVKRDVIRVVTPGTAGVDTAVQSEENNFLACIYSVDNRYGISLADVTTGEVFVSEGDSEVAESSLINTLAVFKPSEIILNVANRSLLKEIVDLKKRYHFFDSLIEDRYFDYDAGLERIRGQFSAPKLGKSDIEDRDYCIRSLGALLLYLDETQKVDLSHLTSLSFIQSGQYLSMDVNSFRNLEITETMREKEKRGSLLGILDKTKTAMGARRLKSWLDRPLINADRISLRSDAVEELTQNQTALEDLTESFKKIYDIERILSRVVYGSCNARDFVALKQSLDVLPEVKAALGTCRSDFLTNIHSSLDTCSQLRLLIECAIVPEPPMTVREGGMIRAGFDKELDRVKDVLNNGTAYIAEMEAEEREKTGIKNLKVAYNRVFGYYIEVSKSQLDKVPEDYIRKQTLVGGERFITQKLKELENNILNAKERVNALEYEDFMSIKQEIFSNLPLLQNTAKLIAVTDALCSLATVALRYNYVKPVVDDGDIIDIKDGRHPIVESVLKDSLFVPNDTYLDTADNRFSIITGPNMAGKSTYMRQTALIVIMAQIGSFVPASSCRIGIVDAVFTRVGASDDLASGQSTFMVEMNEVAHILRNATSRSLVILDEIGRGTSTFDGLSIAWSVAEYISSHIGAKTLFATHYHELTSLEKDGSGIRNYSVAVKKRGDDITFLRKIVKGGTDDSFGIEVAKLAGVPDEVIERAKVVLANIESTERGSSAPVAERFADNVVPEEQSITLTESEVIARLREMDISTLTPIEAMNELYKLQKKVSDN